MREDEMRSRLQNAIDHRLSTLEGDPWLARRIIQNEKGEQPVMRKKISVSIVLVIAAMLLTVSGAVALMNSTIVDKLYGTQEDVPQAVMEQIHTPEATEETALGTLTLDEWLYDGSALHTSFTVANPTEETLLYTLDGIWLNDQHVTYENNTIEGAGTNGFLLGGVVDGASMPVSKVVYNKTTALHQYDENGKYLGQAALPEGEGKLKVSVAVWRPIRQPELVDYDQYEGYDVAETKDHLVVDDKGSCELWMFKPERYNLNDTAAQLSSQVYREAYKELGWAELVDTITVEVDVVLDNAQTPRVTPKEMEYQQGECRVVFTRFDMTLSGGAAEGWIYGDPEEVNDLVLGPNNMGLVLVDKDGQRVLSNGMYWSVTDEGLNFHMLLAPMTGELPQQVYLAHMVADDPRWNENERNYDPSVEKPEHVIGSYQLDYSNEIRIELEKSK